MLLPFAASVTFVFGMMNASQAIARGASVVTGTFYGNLILGLLWTCVGIVHGEVAPLHVWWKACVIGALFLLGQLLTYCAYRFGDVSVATPVLGTKILFVAFLSSSVMGLPVAAPIWIAAFVATTGIALVQWRPRRGKLPDKQKRVGLSVLFALLAAATLSFFDLLLQSWGKESGTANFVPVLFASCALFSLILLPWITSWSDLRQQGSLRPMLSGSLLMAGQAICMSIALSAFGNATQVNIIYALRGMWAVVLGWLLAKHFQGGERHLPAAVLISRALGAILLTAAAIAALI